MTRINLVSPSLLTDAHLLAEYRELPRAFPLAAAALRRHGNPARVPSPPRYTMGTGHVSFFYARTDYLSARQFAIILEMQRRGFTPSHTTPPPPVAGYPLSHWQPDEADIAVNLGRLRERLLHPPRPNFYTYYGKPVDAGFYAR